MSDIMTAVIAVLVATGFLTALGEAIRWWFGRGKVRVDQARVVQGMAIDLLSPLHQELAEARKQTAAIRADLHDLESEMSTVISWALTAKRILDNHQIDYPPVPAKITADAVRWGHYEEGD